MSDNSWMFNFYCSKDTGTPQPVSHVYVFSALEGGKKSKAELISKINRYANRLGR